MNDNRISPLFSHPISWTHWLYIYLLRAYGIYIVLCGPDSYDYLILVIYIEQFNNPYQFFSIASALLNYFSFIHLCKSTFVCINSTWSNRFFFQFSFVSPKIYVWLLIHWVVYHMCKYRFFGLELKFSDITLSLRKVPRCYSFLLELYVAVESINHSFTQ